MVITSQLSLDFREFNCEADDYPIHCIIADIFKLNVLAAKSF